jgi:hypothetical protein
VATEFHHVYTLPEDDVRKLPACVADVLNGRVRLLDNPTLRTQLIGLERHVQLGGRETVTHAHVASARDDLVAAACGAIVSAGDLFAYNLNLAQWI